MRTSYVPWGETVFDQMQSYQRATVCVLGCLEREGKQGSEGDEHGTKNPFSPPARGRGGRMLRNWNHKWIAHRPVLVTWGRRKPDRGGPVASPRALRDMNATHYGPPQCCAIVRIAVRSAGRAPRWRLRLAVGWAIERPALRAQRSAKGANRVVPTG